jgi:hypothetical protein
MNDTRKNERGFGHALLQELCAAMIMLAGVGLLILIGASILR